MVAIDHDRVEAHNAGTQLYSQSDVGAFKVDVLKAQCFRSTSVEITAINKWLDERTIPVRSMLLGRFLMQVACRRFPNSYALLIDL